MINHKKCGWAGSISEFCNTETTVIVDSCIKFYTLHYNETAEQIKSQIYAWQDSFSYLKGCLANYPYPDDLIIFEYILPRSGLSRPDVIIIQKHDSGRIDLKVIEFKSHPNLQENEKWQLRVYLQKLSYYHSFTHDYVSNIEGILISTHPSWDDSYYVDNEHDLTIVGRYRLLEILKETVSCPNPLSSTVKLNKSSSKELLLQFLDSQYIPSPSIVHSARILFHNRDIPRISTVESSNFYNVLEQVESIIEKAQNDRTHHLVLVHGEPGSGKTFLGLKIAHKDYSQHINPGQAVFLSGNRPLVDVLANLTNDTFVQHLYKFKNEYKPLSNNTTQTPYENIFIFDEAQRAWDENKVNHTFNNVSMSEPDIILDIASRVTQQWSVTVALIGQGQEIKGGEEAGLELWANAVRQVSINKQIGYYVHGSPTDLIHFQSNMPANVYLDNSDHLFLNSALRNHDAHQYHKFINSFLEGEFAQAAQYFSLIKDKYLFRWTDSIKAAKSTLTGYASNIKTEDGRFQYGALYSTTSTKPKHFKVFTKTTFYKVPDYVIYHNYRELRGLNSRENNLEAEDFMRWQQHEERYSNCLVYAATEYECQGLELDMALVEWGDDLIYQNNNWQHKPNTYKERDKDAQNPKQLIKNTYRVLLTRGRDATVVFIDDQLLQQLFIRCGVPKLASN